MAKKLINLKKDYVPAFKLEKGQSYDVQELIDALVTIKERGSYRTKIAVEETTWIYFD